MCMCRLFGINRDFLSLFFSSGQEYQELRKGEEKNRVLKTTKELLSLSLPNISVFNDEWRIKGAMTNSNLRLQAKKRHH